MKNVINEKKTKQKQKRNNLIMSGRKRRLIDRHRNLYKRILKEDWEKHRKDFDIDHFYNINEELHAADIMIFGLNQIIIPLTLCALS